MVAYVPGLDEKDPNKLIMSLQQLASGRSNAVGTVTCSTGATTTVTDANCAAGSKVQLTASSSNAAAASTSTWFSSASNGSFVIAHTVASTTDRTFAYSIHG
jgi:hypothetical protein